MHQGFDYPIFLTGLHMLFSWGATALFMQVWLARLTRLVVWFLIVTVDPSAVAEWLAAPIYNRSSIGVFGPECCSSRLSSLAHRAQTVQACWSG